MSLGFACATHFRDVPRTGTNEVHGYLGAASRAPAADVVIDTAPQLEWQSEEIRGTVGVPAVGERVIVVASIDRWIYALDNRTGRAFWRHRAPGSLGTGPLLAGGLVLAASQGSEGELIAIDLYTGKRRWSAQVGDVASPLVIRDGTVYGATQTGAVFAFAVADGVRRWIVGGVPTRSGPTLVGDHLVVATLRDSMVVLRPATGRLIARTALPTTTIAPLAVIDDSTVALASPTGSVLAVAIPSATVRWQASASSPIYGAPVVARDTVFALSNEGSLLAIPREGPGGLVRASIGGLTVSAPVLVRDGVLVAMVDGTMVYFDRVSGRRVWTRRAGGELRHPPIVAQGQIVVAPILGDVMSFR